MSNALDMHGNMSEDEALARALALSMQDATTNDKFLTQEELDLALARQLQASEYHANTAAGNRTSNKDKCAVL
jgi:hypothetical protein